MTDTPVDRAERRQGLIAEGLDIGSPGHVGRHAEDAGAFPAKAAHGLGEGGLFHVADRHVHAFPAERVGQGAADPACPAGDNRGLATELLHWQLARISRSRAAKARGRSMNPE